MDKAILHGALFGDIAVLLIICIGFGLLLYKASSNLVKVMRGDLSSLSKPPLLLTYKIPQAFGRYCELRDGWRGEIPILGQLGIMSLVVWFGISLYTFRFFNFAPFFITFIGFGVMLYGMRLFTRNYDDSISFYREGIGNRSKGRRTRYGFYAKAVIEKVNAEGRTFQVITFIPKRKAWLAAKDEYGFNAEDDITPLIVLLKEQGLPVEETIQGAHFAKLH